MKKRDHVHFSPGSPQIEKAVSSRHESKKVLNQPVIFTHSLTLRNLEADTTYVYAVGDGAEDGWSDLAEF